MRIWICVLLGLTLLGCGYVSTSSYLEHISTLTIPRITIDEVTTTDIPEPTEFEDQLTTTVQRKFAAKWKDGADSLLTLRIKDFVVEPISLDANNNPEQLRMSLILDYTFLDRVKNKVIDSKEQYAQVHDFYIVDDRGEPPETVEYAMSQLVQELADDFYSRLAEQW